MPSKVKSEIPTAVSTIDNFKMMVILLGVKDGVKIAEYACEAALDLLRDPESSLRREIAALSEEWDALSSG